MALITKPLSSSTKAARGARQLAVPVLATIAIIAILYLGRVVFITSIIAVMTAFILEPFVALLVQARFPRGLSSFVVCTIALLFLYVIGMGAYSQLAAVYADLPKYGQRIGDMVDGIQQKLASAEERTYQLLVPARQREQERLRALQQQQAPRKGARREAPPVAPPGAQPPGTAIPEVRIHDESRPIGDYIYARLGTFYQLLLMASFIPFLVYFMLSWRDHIYRSFLQFFQGEDRLVATRALEGIAGMLRAFVVGNFLLGLLLAVVSSSMFWLMRLPFPLLMGPLSGVLSLVPYVGMPLAMVQPLFAALGINTVSLYLLVVVSVAALHLIALNVLYPKIVGSRVHLNPLVVTFSLMFWGFLWDAPGLVLAIPLTAALKAVCDNVSGLRPIGKFLGD